MTAAVAITVLFATSAALARRAARTTGRAAARRHFTPGRQTSTLRAKLARHRPGARRRTAVATAAALPMVLEDVSRALRSGAALPLACRDAAARAPSHVGLDDVLARTARGMPFAEAVAMWPVSRPLPEVRLAAAALALAADAGGRQARAVDGAAATLRERLAVAADVRSQSAQARLSAIVIGCLPLAFTLWACVTDRRTAAFLVAGPPGWACLAAGVALEVAGIAWMRHVLNGVQL